VRFVAWYIFQFYRHVYISYNLSYLSENRVSKHASKILI